MKEHVNIKMRLRKRLLFSFFQLIIFRISSFNHSPYGHTSSTITAGKQTAKEQHLVNGLRQLIDLAQRSGNRVLMTTND